MLSANIASTGYARVEAMYGPKGAGNSRYRDDDEYTYGAFSSPILMVKPGAVMAAGSPAGIVQGFMAQAATPGTGTLQGAVSSLLPAATGFAAVEACPVAGGACVTTTADGAGAFSLPAIPEGDYDVRVFPARGAEEYSPEATRATVTAETTTNVGVALGRATAPPEGTTLAGAAVPGDGVPRVATSASPAVTTTACTGATGTVSASRYGASVGAPAPLTETSPGNYGASLPSLSAAGPHRVEVTVTCPSASPVVTSFDAYATPAGRVHDTAGNPVPEARVTLLRSPGVSAPFAPVEDGDASLSPANRANPVAVDTSGAFGWDVQAGTYRVRAEAPDCTSPSDRANPVVESDAFTVGPAPVPDLDLTLDCTPPTENPIEIQNQAVNPGAPTDQFTYDVTCTVGGNQRSFGPVTVTANGTADTAPIPVGAECTIVQRPANGYRPLGGDTWTLTVDADTGANLAGFTVTTAPPAEVAVSLAGYPNNALYASALCGTDDFGTVRIDAGGATTLPRPVTDDKTCTVRYRASADGAVLASLQTYLLAPEYDVEPNVPFTALLNATPTSGAAPLTVAFDAGSSIVPTGTVTDYTWDFGDGAAPETTTTPSATHTYATPGNHEARVTLTDSYGVPATSEPVAIAVASPTSAGLDLTLSGAYTYESHGPLTTNGITVTPSATGQITRIQGQATFPGRQPNTTATITYDVSQFLWFPVYLGQIALADPGAGINLDTFVFFAPITRPTPTSATSTSTWINFATWPWQPYTLAWTLTQ